MSPERVVDIDVSVPTLGDGPAGPCVQCGRPSRATTQPGRGACPAWPDCFPLAYEVISATLCPTDTGRVIEAFHGHPAAVTAAARAMHDERHPDPEHDGGQCVECLGDATAALRAIGLTR